MLHWLVFCVIPFKFGILRIGEQYCRTLKLIGDKRAESL